MYVSKQRSRTYQLIQSRIARKREKPRCLIIAGPNGAGKTTFARDYLPEIAGLIHFINADLITSGMSPLQPQLAAVSAGKLV
jgi:predicted ABC-type ATPase